MAGNLGRFTRLSRLGYLANTKLHTGQHGQHGQAVFYSSNIKTSPGNTSYVQNTNYQLIKPPKNSVGNALGTVRNFSSEQKDLNCKKEEVYEHDAFKNTLQHLSTDLKCIRNCFKINKDNNFAFHLTYYLDKRYFDFLIKNFITSLSCSKEYILIDKNSKISDGLGLGTLSSQQSSLFSNVFKYIELIFISEENPSVYEISRLFHVNMIISHINEIKNLELQISLLNHIFSKIKNDKNQKLKVIIDILKEINKAKEHIEKKKSFNE